MASGSAGYEAAVYQPVSDAAQQVKLHGEMPMVVNGIDVSDNPFVAHMTAMAHSLKQFFTAFFELKARLPHGAAWDPVRKTADDAYGEASDFTVEFSKLLRVLQLVPHNAKELEKHLGEQVRLQKNEKLTKEQLMTKFKLDTIIKHLEVLKKERENAIASMKKDIQNLVKLAGELGTKDANVCIQAGVALGMFAKTLADIYLEAVPSDVTLTEIITSLTEMIDMVADLDSARDQMEGVQLLMGDLQEGNGTDPLSIGMSLQWMALSNQPEMEWLRSKWRTK